MKAMSVCDYIPLGERGKRNNACSAAVHVKDEFFAKLKRNVVGVNFKFFEAPVL